MTVFGMCPGVLTGENELAAWRRQTAWYGPMQLHRLFFPNLLMDLSESAYDIIVDELSPDEDLWVSCKEVGTTAEFRARVAALRAARGGAGRTWFTLHHEPEGDLTVAAYNAKWDVIGPVLDEEQAWFWPGTIHTAFWSRRVDADGVRVNNWRDWIPTGAVVQPLLRFVGADLYPGAGRPTKSKPNYYEPPGAHASPYGFGEDIGFCGILDEMVAELRSEVWPAIRSDILGGVGEINHERPSTTGGWPASFTDPDGSGCAAWMNTVFQHAEAQGYFGVAWFHKGGGNLLSRSPQAEAEELRSWIRATYDPTVVPDPDDPQYQYGYGAGRASRQGEVDQLSAEVFSLTQQVGAVAGERDQALADLSLCQSARSEAEAAVVALEADVAALQAALGTAVGDEKARIKGVLEPVVAMVNQAAMELTEAVNEL